LARIFGFCPTVRGEGEAWITCPPPNAGINIVGNFKKTKTGDEFAKKNKQKQIKK